MKSSTKKFLAKLLVLCMIVGMIPGIAMGASAATNGDYGTDYHTSDDSSSGSSHTTTTPAVSAPSTSGGETVVTVEVKPSMSGTTASATVTSANMDKAVTDVLATAEKTGTDPIVELEVETPDNAESMKLSLPAASLKKLGANADASLQITSGVADIALDADAIAALAKQAGSNATISVGPVVASALSAAQKTAVGSAPVYDFSITSGGKAITKFDGGVLTVALPFTLPSGKSASDVVVYYLTDAGKLEACDTRYSRGTVTFSTTHLSKYVIGDAAMGDSNPFTDVKAADYYYDAVLWAVEKSITSGTTATTFSPNAPCTRAQIMTFLWKANGSPKPAAPASFTDVAADAYYADAVAWAVEKGITSGTTTTTFSPDAPCTRAQAMTFLYKAKGSPAVTGASGFSDVAADAYYANPVAWAVKNSITSGTSTTTFGSNDTCTRGQIMVFLYKTYGA